MTDSALPIERIRVSILSAPISDTVPMSFGQLDDRRVCLVEVSAGGVTGVGESWVNYPGWAHAERIATLCEGVAPHLIGLDALDPPAALDVLTTALLPVGRQAGAIGPIWQAISGVDIALWDLAGRVRDMPVHRLLREDSTNRAIPAYASGIGPTHVEAFCDQALEGGFRAVKTKIGFGRQRDDETVRIARTQVGADVTVFADANQAWDLEEARREAAHLARYDVGWIEEPLTGDRLSDIEKLAVGCEIPVATGENVYGAEEFAQYVDSGAVSFIQPDLAKSGGFTIAKGVAERAASHGVRVAPHCYSGAIGIAAGVQLGMAYDVVDWIELDVRPNPLRTDLLAEPMGWQDGEVALPRSSDAAPAGEPPGLGIDLDPAALREFRTHLKEITTHD